MPHCQCSHCDNCCCDSSRSCDNHCSSAPGVHLSLLPKEHICALTHYHLPLPEVVSVRTTCTIPPPEVVTTTVTYTVPPPVVEYEKVTTSVSLLPQPPVSVTEVRESSLRCPGRVCSCHVCRSRSRSSSYHCHWSVGCTYKCRFSRLSVALRCCCEIHFFVLVSRWMRQ